MTKQDPPVRTKHINLLPLELLSIIFIQYFRFKQKEDYRHNRSLPLSLASVCQFWRQVATTTPSLWTTCWLSYTHPDFNTIWLSRTGTMLFEIDGLPAPSYWVPGLCCPTRLLHTVSPFMQRCRSLSIAHVYHASPILTLHPIPTINLRFVRLEGFAPSPPLAWLHQSVSQSPRLEILQVNHFSSHLVSALANLTELGVSRLLDINQVREFLTKAPKLDTLAFKDTCSSLDSDPVEIPPNLGPITHERLVNLRFSSPNRARIEWVFNTMTLPSLRVLDVCYPKTGSQNGLPAGFHTFLQRSQCPLRVLSLRGFDSDSVILALTSQFMSSLEGLECKLAAVTPQLLLFITDITNLPHLSVLKLSSIWFPMIEAIGLLADMITARRTLSTAGQAHKLKHFEISFIDRTLYVDTHHSVSNYADQALRISTLAKASENEAEPFVVSMGGLPCITESDAENLRGPSPRSWDEDDE